MKKIGFRMLELVSFPFLWVFFYLVRMFGNVVNLIMDLLSFKFLFVIIDVVTLPIDAVVGIFVSLSLAASAAIDMGNDRFNLEASLAQTKKQRIE